VAKQVLARVSALARSEPTPPRSKVVEFFCRATQWFDRKGRLCVASANVALKRLEDKQVVELPPPLPRHQRKEPRRLADDGEPLPPCPATVRLEEIQLQRIEGQKDPDHKLWNRLIVREHPLGAAPLFGAQLRYLVRCSQGVVGAIGIGPASFRLECRDTWIGWDRATRVANLPLALGLSRLLIRPGIRCANLATRIYGLLLQRVAADWQERYGVKPVLIETFVDRRTHTGRSLAAANWQRLGSSTGRGRSSPSPKVRPKTIKDVWVYELRRQARQGLLSGPVALIPPRSIFYGINTESWAGQELDGLDLGDARLERRFALMLEARWKAPERSFYRSFGSAASGKAAYRLIESHQAEVSFATLLAPFARQTQRRMAAETVVVLAQDTTPLSYNTLQKTTGLGSVGDQGNPGRGLWLHSMQAFRTDGIPLGCAWAKLWARPPESDTDRRNEQSVAEKESARWIEAYQAARRLALSMPQTHVIAAGDRESDIFELFDQTEVRPDNLHLLVRAQHDRWLTEGAKLWHELSTRPLGGTMTVRIPRRGQRRARQATLELRWAPIQAAAPRVALKKSWKPIPLFAVIAREVDPPPGEEPIEWVLLTDWKVDTLKMARRLVKWYAQRWGIECWHQVLKDVCKVEKRQMATDAALGHALVLDMIVAWRALLLCRLGKAHPALPASLYYSLEELAVLDDYKKKLPAHAQSVVAQPATELPPPEPTDLPLPPSGHVKPEARRNRQPTLCSSLSLFQANLLVAILAGFWARKSDGHPGPKILAQGLVILSALVDDRKLTAQASAGQPPRRGKRPREPG
jgi:hypothetical protein